MAIFKRSSGSTLLILLEEMFLLVLFLVLGQNTRTTEEEMIR